MGRDVKRGKGVTLDIVHGSEETIRGNMPNYIRQRSKRERGLHTKKIYSPHREYRTGFGWLNTKGIYDPWRGDLPQLSPVDYAALSQTL